MDSKSFIYEYLSNQKLAVLSIVTSDNKPQSAVIGFGQTKDLIIVFGTDISSRKYKHLLANPAVSMVIGWSDNKTVQLEGTANELTSDDLPLISDNYWNKNPKAKKYHNNSGQRYFSITPNWIRYTDLSTEPWDIIVLEF